jgi:hypothetical protein
MPAVVIELNDDEYQQLAEAASTQGTTPDELVRRWVRQRLVHERERAAGGGRPMSPRARREAEGEGA